MTFQSKGNTMNTPPPSDTQGTPKDEKKRHLNFFVCAILVIILYIAIY